MLVLSRKVNESIVIDGQIRITLLMIRGNQVRIGIAAPGRVVVLREELLGTDRATIRAAATRADRPPNAAVPPVTGPVAPPAAPRRQEPPAA
jgi:carbon storage regulator